jgi:hypothetical protein
MNNHEEYYDTLEDNADINFFITDIHEELDNLERLVHQNETAKVMVIWIRDTIRRVAENYKT